MSDFKGTKGKWTTSGISGRMIKSIDPREFGFIADVDTKANALLISKSPEMLQVLQDVVFEFENSPKPSSDILMDLLGKAKKIIKEATEL